MRRALILLIPVLLSLPAGAAAQERGAVQGAVVAAGTREPLPASVVVRSAADSSVVARGTAGAGGRFRLDGLAPGRYLVETTSLGYEVASRAVEVTAASPTADLGTLALSAAAVALEGVRIEGQRPDMLVAPDRTIFRTQDMPVAAGGVATDVLQSVPELEVDVNGGVSLRGNPPEIYLNGRPAPVQGEALEQFLQQLPADRIDRVEVLPNPSARFEAEGAGGIVNIVLKQNTELGLSGSVFTNASTRGNLGGGARLAYQRGRLTLFGGTSLRVSQQDETSSDLRTNLLARPVTLLEQDARSSESGLSGNVDLTAELALTPRATLWGEIGVRGSGDDSEGLTAYRLSESGGVVPLERYDRAETGDQERLSRDLTVGFRHVIQPNRHELTAELRYDTEADTELTRILEQPFPVVGGDPELPQETTLDSEEQDESELRFEVGYVRPFRGEGQIEMGYRGEVQESGNDRRIETFVGVEDGAPDELTRTGHDFREVFNSAFLIVTRPLGPFGVQLGGRAELANTELTIPSLGETFGNDYASLFPSANVTYQVREGREIRLSYSRRIRRPSPRVMNPIDASRDPLNRRVGNPEIDPQYAHSFSLESSWANQLGTLRLSPYYRATVDEWTEIKTVDAQGVSTVTWRNLASVDSYGTSVTGSLRPIGGWSGFASLSANREVRDASNLSDDFSGSAWRWTARGNVNARLSPSLSLQGMLFYTPPREVPQGRVGRRIMTHFGLRQDLWDDRASVRLALTDPFDLSRSSFETRDLTHVQTGRTSRKARSAVLSFSYNFGRPPREARAQDEAEPEAEEEPTIR